MFQAEVAHRFQHQPILIGIMHMVDRHVRMSLHDGLRHRPSSAQAFAGIIGIAENVPHRAKKCLRQPRNVQCRCQMRERAVR